MSFPTDKTTKDLSDLPENQNFPSYHSSMAGGNMVTTKSPYFAGRGIDSEATHDVEETNTDWIGYSHDPPVLTDEPSDEKYLGTDEQGSSYTPKPHTWKELH